MLAAPDTAAQLMKLRETEAVRVLDDHDAGIGHVYAYFDDRGCDKDIKLLVAVTAHDLVFIRRFHCAMQQAKAQVGENMIAKAFVLYRHRFDGQRFRFLDQWADDESLATFRDLLRDDFIGFVTASAGAPAGDDLLSTRRELVDHRNVEIAIEGQRKSTRDRCGRHDQHM